VIYSAISEHAEARLSHCRRAVKINLAKKQGADVMASVNNKKMLRKPVRRRQIETVCTFICARRDLDSAFVRRVLGKTAGILAAKYAL
jgi:hypothetical protein